MADAANVGRTLYGYFRSSAAYRVRIALNLKGLGYAQAPVSLLRGEQRSADYLALNPQGLVPALLDNGVLLTQSLAICEYLDEAYPDSARLLPDAAVARAQVRAVAQAIACDIHPLNNLRVLNYLKVECLPTIRVSALCLITSQMYLRISTQQLKKRQIVGTQIRTTTVVHQSYCLAMKLRAQLTLKLKLVAAHHMAAFI